LRAAFSQSDDHARKERWSRVSPGELGPVGGVSLLTYFVVVCCARSPRNAPPEL
jgi:hypothetical protein